MAGEPDEQTVEGQQTVSVDAALKLLEGEQNEAKVLGATLLLSHHTKLLMTEQGRAERCRLRAAICGKANFLCRLLQSSLPLQRLALGLMTVLLAGTDAQEAAVDLLDVVPFVAACASKTEISTSEAEHWGLEELTETLDVLKRWLDVLPPSKVSSEFVQGTVEVLALLLPSKKFGIFLAKEDVAARVLALVEPLLAHAQGEVCQDLVALLEAIVLEPSFRGGVYQSAALQLLGFRGPYRPLVLQRLDEVISCSLASGADAQRALLQLVAGLLAGYGVRLKPDGHIALSRLKTLLVLAAGELRMALEGYGSKEGLVAACMLLEESIVALGKEAEILESNGNLEEVSESLRELHRALQDIFDYCADLPVTVSPPEELAIIARVVAAFQLEDPRQFSSEFERTIGTFCSLEPAEFKVLLPSLQELQDWHCTRAFPKVLEVARWGLERADPEADPEAWRQCAMMIAEVALDAAAYLPDINIPDVDKLDEACETWTSDAPEFVLSCSILSGIRLPRPVPAADATHEGAQRLCLWSRRLWQAGQKLLALPLRQELALLCASLLTSVPGETVQRWWPHEEAAKMWAVLSECILGTGELEATTGRLAVRLVGFCLDRHQALPQALVRVAHRLNRRTVSKSIQDLLKNLSSDDEWEIADRAAFKAVQEFLAASAHIIPSSASPKPAVLGGAGGYSSPVLDDMD